MIIGAGTKSIAGFSGLTINAQQVEGQGVGSLLVAAPIDINAARVTGVHRVFKIGGAQAIAAMAYGTESVPKCDKLFGPGNSWVMRSP